MDKVSKVYKWIGFVQKFLYPPICVLCGKPGYRHYTLCRGCLAELPRNGLCCRCCGIPLTTGGSVCGPCSASPPPYARSVIPFRYAAPMDHLLQRLKFNHRLELAPLLGTLMAEAVQQRAIPLPELLLPVPLSPARTAERGYNQALELARIISGRLAIPLEWRQCQRVRHTVAQTSLKRTERQGNLRGAFAVKGTLPSHVAIIDDVVTTGATVGEFAKTLRRAGVEEVEVWACARAGRG